MHNHWDPVNECLLHLHPAQKVRHLRSAFGDVARVLDSLALSQQVSAANLFRDDGEKVEYVFRRSADT
jgi:hypothetical protein